MNHQLSAPKSPRRSSQIPQNGSKCKVNAILTPADARAVRKANKSTVQAPSNDQQSSWKSYASSVIRAFRTAEDVKTKDLDDLAKKTAERAKEVCFWQRCNCC